MSKDRAMNRRDLLKGAGAAAVSIVAASAFKASAETTPESAQADAAKAPLMVPKRKLGRTNIEVPILSLGGMFDTVNSQMLLKRAVQVGVTYWDTAASYSGGKSEEGMGTFIEKNPQLREKMFLVTKASGASDSAGRDDKLATSLSKLKTDYVDLYYGVHGLSAPAQLNDELKNWAHAAKEKGLIKHFGFSTHSNMADCLSAAADTDWIDAIMTTYNYQLIGNEAMQKAVDKCVKKGIALIAMKTQAKGAVDNQDYKLVSVFQDKGWTMEQAKLKAVWKDERFCAICSQMPNFTILNANVEAATDPKLINESEIQALKQGANRYCDGCESICTEACGGRAFVRDVMRSLMYANSYGDYELGKETFNAIPDDTRAQIMDLDLSVAERRCPRHLPIANMVKQACFQFA